MGWISLTLRRQSLQAAIQEHELRDIELSRQTRRVHRQLSYDQSICDADKTSELRAIKESYIAIRDQRPDVSSDEYQEWSQEYANAKEDYEAQKLDINDYYDGINEELETEATDEETRLQDEQTTLEAQLEAMRAELDTVKEQISSDIDSSKISLS